MHLSQTQLAIVQLNDAVAIFLDKHSYPSVVTLAGAAEEIFGIVLRKQSEENALEWQWKMQEQLFKIFKEGKDQQKDFDDESNKIRNLLKHYMEAEVSVEDLQDAAIKMIIRANENAARLELSVKRMSEFERWFYENVVEYEPMHNNTP